MQLEFWSMMIANEVLVADVASMKSHRKLEMLGGLHWWIASIFRALFPHNEMPCKHDWASDVATSHTKKDCRSFIHLLSKRKAGSLQGTAMINISKASISSRQYRLMVYYLHSTAGQVGQAQISLPICYAVFHWPYFGGGLYYWKHFHIW